MKVLKLVIGVILISVFSSSRAELTLGITSVYLDPDKQQICILYDGVKIECGLPEGQWVPIAVYIPSSKSYFDYSTQVKMGDQLIDSKGITIGKVTSGLIRAMPLHNTITDTYELRITGYILSENIRQNSIPENQLAVLISSNIEDLNFNVFKPFIQEYGFYELENFIEKLPQYKVYFYYVSYYWDNNIHLIFENNQLVAVLHTRALVINNLESIKTQTNNLLWLNNSDLKAKNKFFSHYQKKYEMTE